MSSDVLPRFESVLRFASTRSISDVHVKPGLRPIYRRFGQLISRKDEAAFSDAELAEVARAIVPEQRTAAFAAGDDVTFTHDVLGCGRFRVSLGRQRGGIGCSVRLLPGRAATLRELRLPPLLASWAQHGAGLLLVTGPAGSGRTTTWAALVEQINTAAAGPRHVVTLEATVEVLFDDKLAFIRQRELGLDVADLATGLDAALRMDADAVAISELPPTALEAALTVAEQGRLVIAATPAGGVVDLLRRLLEAVPAANRELLRQRLAASLRGVVAQRLVTSADGKQRLPAAELLVPTPQALEILRGSQDPGALQAIIDSGRAAGMQSLDQALLSLVQGGAVGLDAALVCARQPDALRARFSEAAAPPVATGDDRLF